MVKFTRQELRKLLEKLKDEATWPWYILDRERAIITQLVKKYLMARYGEGSYDKRRSSEED